jgi:glycosyltransferase involved in cell wall biosynthesis
MASGTSVVAPAGPPYSEFADGVAVSVDPLDPDSIANGLREAIAGRSALGQLGLERAKEFSWRRAAEAHLDVYREVTA